MPERGTKGARLCEKIEAKRSYQLKVYMSQLSNGQPRSVSCLIQQRGVHHAKSSPGFVNCLGHQKMLEELWNNINVCFQSPVRQSCGRSGFARARICTCRRSREDGNPVPRHHSQPRRFLCLPKPTLYLVGRSVLENDQHRRG